MNRESNNGSFIHKKRGEILVRQMQRRGKVSRAFFSFCLCHIKLAVAILKTVSFPLFFLRKWKNFLLIAADFQHYQSVKKLNNNLNGRLRLLLQLHSVYLASYLGNIAAAEIDDNN